MLPHDGARPPPRSLSAPVRRTVRRRGRGSSPGRSRRPGWRSATRPAWRRDAQWPHRPWDEESHRQQTEQGDPQPEQEVLGQMEEAEQRAGKEDGDAEADHQPGDDDVGPPLARSGRSTGHDDRNDGNDAGGEPGDQPTEKGDDQEFTHGSRFLADREEAPALLLLGCLPIEPSGLPSRRVVALGGMTAGPPDTRLCNGDQRELDLSGYRHRRCRCARLPAGHPARARRSPTGSRGSSGPLPPCWPPPSSSARALACAPCRHSWSASCRC